MENIKIFYKSEKVEKDFDNAIEKFLKPLGFKWWASGYNFVEGIRDLAFDKIKQGDT